ncbi:hypothetical protein GCM10022223_56000 [Kineosporia mesophila]|uniref:GAF domain-containing protein n=1 Tax=Kineosporia mesophila TaxID=566012 RepID=A0ABP7AF20_9ACTN|nr:GAF domain-containing protein [Kineosporia mesophila]MCD5352900.1 GAF domain-containing protein [Kineosporia mesophila]
MSTVKERLGRLDRMQELTHYDFDAPGLKPALDALSCEATEYFSMPASLTSVVLDSAQIIAGCHGLRNWMQSVAGMPVEWSFCADVVLAAEPFVVTDTSADPIRREHPAVTFEGVGAYAGVPLLTPSGHVLGAFCVMGGEARTFTDTELTHLRELGDEAARLMLAERRLYLD